MNKLNKLNISQSAASIAKSFNEFNKILIHELYHHKTSDILIISVFSSNKSFLEMKKFIRLKIKFVRK